jgi:hypothetical protein
VAAAAAGATAAARTPAGKRVVSKARRAVSRAIDQVKETAASVAPSLGGNGNGNGSSSNGGNGGAAL